MAELANNVRAVIVVFDDVIPMGAMATNTVVKYLTSRDMNAVGIKLGPKQGADVLKEKISESAVKEVVEKSVNRRIQVIEQTWDSENMPKAEKDRVVDEIRKEPDEDRVLVISMDHQELADQSAIDMILARYENVQILTDINRPNENPDNPHGIEQAKRILDRNPNRGIKVVGFSGNANNGRAFKRILGDNQIGFLKKEGNFMETGKSLPSAKEGEDGLDGLGVTELLYWAINNREAQIKEAETESQFSEDNAHEVNLDEVIEERRVRFARDIYKYSPDAGRLIASASDSEVKFDEGNQDQVDVVSGEISEKWRQSKAPEKIESARDLIEKHNPKIF